MLAFLNYRPFRCLGTILVFVFLAYLIGTVMYMVVDFVIAVNNKPTSGTTEAIISTSVSIYWEPYRMTYVDPKTNPVILLSCAKFEIHIIANRKFSWYEKNKINKPPRAHSSGNRTTIKPNEWEGHSNLSCYHKTITCRTTINNGYEIQDSKQTNISYICPNTSWAQHRSGSLVDINCSLYNCLFL